MRTLCSIALVVIGYLYGRHDASRRPRELDTGQMVDLLMEALVGPLPDKRP